MNTKLAVLASYSVLALAAYMSYRRKQSVSPASNEGEFRLPEIALDSRLRQVPSIWYGEINR